MWMQSEESVLLVWGLAKHTFIFCCRGQWRSGWNRCTYTNFAARKWQTNLSDFGIILSCFQSPCFGQSYKTTESGTVRNISKMTPCWTLSFSLFFMYFFWTPLPSAVLKCPPLHKFNSYTPELMIEFPHNCHLKRFKSNKIYWLFLFWAQGSRFLNFQSR